jgi:hypothetical protein
MIEQFKYHFDKLILIFLAILCAFLFEIKSGDASIYFTFFKNFFDLPFSYANGVVSYGATSPLHVLINALVHYYGGVLGLEIVNFSFLFLAVYIQSKTLDRGFYAYFILLLLTLLNIPLLRSTAALFETSLAYLAISIMFYAFVKSRLKLLITTAALLPLIRPELMILSAFVFIQQFFASRERKTVIVTTIILSSLPLLIYFVWMYIHTNTLIPASIEARALTAMELGDSYLERLIVTAKSLLTEKSNVIYGILGIGIVLAFFKKQMTWQESAFFILPALPFIISPPGYYIYRYLLPATAIATLLTAKILTIFIEKHFTRHKFLVLVLTIVLITPTVFYKMNKESKRYDYDTLLLKPLAEFLNSYITEKNAAVLIYEIQGQYYIKARCYSLDGIVGRGELLPFLRKEISLKDVLNKYSIKYIVTMNSFSYRKVFQGTALVSLYQHDLNSVIGDSISIEGMTLKKNNLKSDFLSF